MARLPLTKPLYSLEEAADILGYSEKSLRDRIKTGEIEARKDRQQWRISAGAIQDYWDSLESNRPPAA